MWTNILLETHLLKKDSDGSIGMYVSCVYQNHLIYASTNILYYTLGL